jgi:hypothetical protein
MYSLQCRYRPAQRNPDLRRRIIRFVRERQVLTSIQKRAKQMDGGQAPSSFRMNDELGTQGRSNLCFLERKMTGHNAEKTHDATVFRLTDQ